MLLSHTPVCGWGLGAPSRRCSGIAIPKHLPLSRGAADRISGAGGLRASAGPTNPPVAREKAVEIRGVEAYPVDDDTTMLNAVCDERFRFAVEYGLNRGSSINSYLIKGSAPKSTVLIDVPDAVYADPWLESLRAITPLNEIDYLILTTLPPTCVPLIVRFIEEANCSKRNDFDRMMVVMSNPALMALRAKLGQTEEGAAILSQVSFIAARRDVPLKLGDGRELTFIRTPTPRWPDCLTVHDTSSGNLFTSKFFSCHRAPDEGTPPTLAPPETLDKYQGDYRYYYQCTLAPVARQAAICFGKLKLVSAQAATKESAFAGLLGAVKRTLKTAIVGQPAAGVEAKAPVEKTIVVSRVCPRHGPELAGQDVETLLGLYNEWLEGSLEAASRSTVAVLYASAYGHTATLAQAISRGITQAGVGVETLNLEVVGMEETLEVLASTDGFVIGSPTLGGHLPTQVTTALGAIIRDNTARAQPCGVFGSYGWSGEAVDELEQKLKDSGFQMAFEPIRSKFRADDAVLTTCQEAGAALANNILLEQKRLKRQAQKRSGQKTQIDTTTPAQQALARVMGALGVVTCLARERHVAVVSSSIAQASFVPPGITLSVPRTPETEAMLIINAQFNVNVLAQGQEAQYTEPVQAGGLKGIEYDLSEETGCARLPAAAACLECVVKDRIKAGNQWIMYAEVTSGQVLNEGALGAVYSPSQDD